MVQGSIISGNKQQIHPSPPKRIKKFVIMKAHIYLLQDSNTKHRQGRQCIPRIYEHLKLFQNEEHYQCPRTSITELVDVCRFAKMKNYIGRIHIPFKRTQNSLLYLPGFLLARIETFAKLSEDFCEKTCLHGYIVSNMLESKETCMEWQKDYWDLIKNISDHIVPDCFTER